MPGRRQDAPLATVPITRLPDAGSGVSTQAKTLKVAGRGECSSLAETIFQPDREQLDGKPLGSGGPKKGE